MKEYDKISEFTKKYLQGSLYKLTVQYLRKNDVMVSVVYEDEYDTFYDYNFEIDLQKNKMDFRGHDCLKPLFKLSLDRDSEFEEEVINYLYATI